MVTVLKPNGVSIFILLVTVSIVTYLLIARTVDPEKQPLLANGSESTFVSMQRLGKHILAATDTQSTVEVLSEMVLSTHSVQKDYKEDN
jgi:hypothetical protein